MKNNIRLELNDKILTMKTRRNDAETHNFNISSTKEVTINNVIHTVITSDNNDVFYIVDGKFHREDDRPAITCRRFDLDMTLLNGNSLSDQSEISEQYDDLKKVWCKIWMTNGQFNRTNDKPALIFENGDLMWFENGDFARNPFENSSVYLPNLGYAISYNSNDSDNMVFHDIKEKEKQENDGLFDYSYSKDS